MSAGALACGAIGVAAVIAAYKGDEKGRAGSFFFWLLAVFAVIGAANS